MKIVLASDHAGFLLKGEIVSFLQEKGFSVEDLGPHTLDPNDDYPDFVRLVGEAVGADPDNVRGIILGGSGQGEAIVANRFLGVRAGVFYGAVTPVSPIDISAEESKDSFAMIRLMRGHDDTNVLSLGARFLSTEDAIAAVEIWINTPFSEEERHSRRVKKIDSVTNH